MANGKIKGAIKNGKMWLIPKDAKLPDTGGGQCGYFGREKLRDIIGVCFCEKLRIKPNENPNQTTVKEAAT